MATAPEPHNGQATYNELECPQRGKINASGGILTMKRTRKIRQLPSDPPPLSESQPVYQLRNYKQVSERAE